MAKSQVKIGSQGSDVTELQKILNQNGYKLDEDGIFGSKTQAAVLDYQKKNGLTPDAIVGEKTWGSLLGGSTNTNTTNTTTGNGFNYKDFTYDEYKESDLVKQAQYALQSQLLKKPGAYESQWQTQLDDIMNKILNREKFSYDLNGDALYQQYKDKFVQQGKMAMGDAIGQASAMTGGYGNSYAQSVGQQAYQAQLNNLNDIVPELYQMAYDKYNQEGQDMLNQYAMVGDREDRDYGRYRDTVSDWLTERDYLTNRYDTERDFDYSKYNNERDFAYGQYSDNKSYAYQGYRDKIEDAKWQADFDEAKRQYDETMALKTGSIDTTGGNTTEKDKTPLVDPKPTTEPTAEPAKKYSDFSNEEYNKNSKQNGGSGYATVLTHLKSMKANGASSKEAQAFLEEALGNSHITPSDYTSLYNKYRDGKLG